MLTNFMKMSFSLPFSFSLPLRSVFQSQLSGSDMSKVRSPHSYRQAALTFSHDEQQYGSPLEKEN
eukprot:SAG31_NODE_2718_length_5191_cov_1.988806_3_plen_65_part_00